MKEPKRFAKAEAMRELEEEMLAAAGALEFEKAARLRDQLRRVEALPEVDGMAEEPVEEPKPRPKAGMPGTRAGRGKKGRK
jgi:excinuclease UvrABC nuclease subunit